MSWADRKAAVRRIVHKTFAVRCLYREGVGGVVELHARLHTRVVTGGNTGVGGAYAQVVEGVETISFSKEELLAKGITPKRNAIVSFPDYGSNFALDARDSDSGPIIEKWSLAGT